MLLRVPKYMSPSSLSQILKQPHTFYLQRCMLTPVLPREAQSKAAAVGTAFDCLVKQGLHATGVPFGTKIPAHRLGDAEDYFVEDLYSSLENHKVEALIAGNKIYNVYKKAGLIGKTKTKWTSVEAQKSLVMQDVPLFGKLDAVVWDEEYQMNVPFDWKVSGYTAQTGMSPKAGFMEIFDDGWKDSHKSYTPKIEMKDIDEGFARQFTTYGWMLGLYGKEFPVYFDHVVFNGDNSKIRIARYRAIVTTKYQSELLAQYVDAWTSLTDGRFLERLISKSDLLACEIMAMGESWF